MTAAGGPVYLVGLRYGHHARHSGYEGFQRYIGSQLQSPVRFRFLKFKRFPLLGWRIDRFVAWLAGRRCFSLGLMMTEWGAAAHMVSRRQGVYHVLYGDTDLWKLGRAGRLTGNAVVASFHEAAEGLEWLEIGRKLAESIDGVILVSGSQRSYFEKLLPAEKIFVVPHGVDTAFFEPGGERSAQPMFVTVGGHLRDFRTLQQAIDLVLEKRPDTRIVAVGTRHGHEGAPLEHSQVEHMEGITDGQLRSLYRSAWAGVYCLKQATANNSILEAMSCGTPVVATDTGGIREYTGAEAAILCPAQDPESTARAMLRVVEETHRWREMRAAARERALRFDYLHAAEQLAAVYDTIGNRQFRRPA